MSARSAAETADLFASSIRVQERIVAQMGGYGTALIEASVGQALSGGTQPLGQLPTPPTSAAKQREIVFISQDAVVRRIWQQNRVVYDIDTALWDELGHTDLDTVVPAGLFRHLPHPDPFIAIPVPLVVPLQEPGHVLRVRGFFVVGRAQPGYSDQNYVQVSTHHERSTGAIGLLICGTVETLDGKTVMARIGNIPDSIYNRVTLDTDTDRDMTARQLVDAILPRFSAQSFSGGADALPELVTACVSALIYVCSMNAELRPLAAPAAKRQAKGAAKPAKVIKVGYEIGAALRAYRRTDQAEQRRPGGGQTKRPHIRRAHFHTYRVGAGRKESIVKWLSPIPINVSGPAEKTTVVKVP